MLFFWGIFSLSKWSMECSYIVSLTQATMVIRGLVFHPFVLYSVYWWIVFGVFVCMGLLWESVVTICEFNELDCVFGGR
jgi:hypothetical protein